MLIEGIAESVEVDRSKASEPENILSKLDIDTSDLPDLKPRQIRFLNYYFAGKTRVEAYKLAGYKHKQADSAAWRLCNTDPVQKYIKLCKEKMKPIATYADKVNLLWEIANNSHEKDIAIKAISELNKMQGDIAPIQTQSVHINTNATLEDIRNARLEYKKEK